jgi:hypothetical protein
VAKRTQAINSEGFNSNIREGGVELIAAKNDTKNC